VANQEAAKAFITRASRGIGAKTAEAFAHLGFDVAVGYETRQKLAEEVVATVIDTGRNAISVGGDITVPEVRQRIVDEVSEWAPILRALILNAAGGMEPKRADDPDYPLAINHDSSLALIDGLTVNLAQLNADVVYVQSYAGHLHGEIEIPSEKYSQRVAGPKNEAEKALREIMSDLDDLGIRFQVVTGGIVGDTTVGKVSLRDEELATKQRELDNVVTASEMGWRIAAAVVNPLNKTGNTEVVGANLNILREELKGK
jgi:NAD(P)-dependent dehydrogenase (short-subunit alcohol dehydrogenase family)